MDLQSLQAKASFLIIVGYNAFACIVICNTISYNKEKMRGGCNMATRSANVNVRVEPNVKKQAEDILDKLGVSASAFINMTYRQVIMKRGIPFSVELPAEIKTLDSLTDAEFDEMMQTGLAQAKRGESVHYEEALNQLIELGKMELE